jgi:hypothetical protein
MEETKKSGNKGKHFLFLPKKRHLLEKMGKIYLDRIHCGSFRNFRTFLCCFSRILEKCRM